MFFDFFQMQFLSTPLLFIRKSHWKPEENFCKNDEKNTKNILFFNTRIKTYRNESFSLAPFLCVLTCPSAFFSMLQDTKKIVCWQDFAKVLFVSTYSYDESKSEKLFVENRRFEEISISKITKWYKKHVFFRHQRWAKCKKEHFKLGFQLSKTFFSMLSEILNKNTEHWCPYPIFQKFVKPNSLTW